MTVMNLSPSEIRYSQDSIGSTFGRSTSHPYKPIGETLDDILLGRRRVTDIPTISVQKRDGLWFTGDNRRLWVFRKAEEFGKCDSIPVHVCYYINPAKFTTYNEGISVCVRGNEGGWYWKTKTPVRKPALSSFRRTTNAENDDTDRYYLDREVKNSSIVTALNEGIGQTTPVLIDQDFENGESDSSSENGNQLQNDMMISEFVKEKEEFRIQTPLDDIDDITETESETNEKLTGNESTLEVVSDSGAEQKDVRIDISSDEDLCQIVSENHKISYVNDQETGVAGATHNKPDSFDSRGIPNESSSEDMEAVQPSISNTCLVTIDEDQDGVDRNPCSLIFRYFDIILRRIFTRS